MELITKAAIIATLVGNDVWYVHWNAKGDKFDQIHNISYNYYDTLARETDDLMEFSMDLGVPVINLSNALAYIPDYKPEIESQYMWDGAIQVFKSKLPLYTNTLQELRDTTTRSDIQSRIDEWLQYWNKELNYKLVRRSNSNQLYGFYDSGLDTALANQFTIAPR